jgi:hypothetical protein
MKDWSTFTIKHSRKSLKNLATMPLKLGKEKSTLDLKKKPVKRA